MNLDDLLRADDLPNIPIPMGWQISFRCDGYVTCELNGRVWVGTLLTPIDLEIKSAPSKPMTFDEFLTESTRLIEEAQGRRR